jgi:CubicO group peptidase (beta-lactamase class C family)
MLSIRQYIFRTAALSLFVAATLLAAGAAESQSTLSPELRSKIDQIAQQSLKSTGVPSASIAVVQDGKIAYVQAYGDAKLDPQTPATPAMRYSIGSISKQFTAAAILMLAEEGKLSLDDPVSKYVSGLTDGDKVTIRQLLSHTSGYQDYWPQDYAPPLMLKPITAQQIMDRWARIPLDFPPGTKWQYSNTNYVIAGLIVEKVAGMSLVQLLNQRVFTPLAMKSVADADVDKLTSNDPVGYMRYALGPPRPAPKEGPGWMFAAFELSMTAEDLAKWDISIMDQTILKPASYVEMEREVQLKSGVGSRYGLGVQVSNTGGHRRLEHGGEASGFVSDNVVLPDDKIAVAVLTNQDASAAAGDIAGQVASLLLKAANPNDPKQDEVMRKVYDGLQQGKVDRTLFTDNANFYFNDQALKDYASSLGPLGAPQSFAQARSSLRGGMTARIYSVKYPNKDLTIVVYQMPDGKIEQYQVVEE